MGEIAQGRAFKVCLFLLLLLASNPGTAGQESVVARNGVVATDQKECSEIGTRVLREGGNAVDAAVAATFCLGVVCPSYSGIGGGGFMLVRSSSGEAEVFDMREMAPGGAHQDHAQYKFGPLSIAIPGQVAGLYTAHDKYGKLPWRELVKPAEELARKGFQILFGLYKSMKNTKSTIMSDEELKSLFSPDGKQLLSQGDIIRFSKLADTLALIAENGSNVFYNGLIARRLARDIQRAGGIITKEDFRNYRVVTRKPLVATVLGHKLVTAPPPASGGAVVILILKILSNYINSTGDFTEPGLLDHRLIEALKFALSLRTNLGDPKFVDDAKLKANTTTVLRKMISTSYAKKLKNLINDKKTYEPDRYGSKWRQIYDHGTTHLCVVDKQRNVVTMTMSLNSYFGSKMVSPSTGIFLNNQMNDFSIPSTDTPPPSPANFAYKYKRPLSSMAPIILLEGNQVSAVIGASGGLLIPDAVTEVLVNHFIRKLNPVDAVRSPRFYHELYPNVLYHEDFLAEGSRLAISFTEAYLKEMKKKGHKLEKINYWTVCQFVIQKLEGPDSGQLVAVSDLRKGGSPAGY
ncbi:hypothetical protein CASFOL_015612 [Castilleja foliolosa]|uniref:Glutathione hydrolase n=1 Tax=Castilleja foliolosa TaxID=1961234 RepID=A0ABD3DHX5_9LAMI